MKLELIKLGDHKKLVGVIIFGVIVTSFYLLFFHKTPEERVNAFIDEIIGVEDRTDVTRLIQDYFDSVGNASPNEIYKAAEKAKKASLETMKITERIDVPKNLSKEIRNILLESQNKIVRTYELFASAFDDAMTYYGSGDIRYAYSFRAKFNEGDKLLDEAIDDLYVASLMVEVEDKVKKQIAAETKNKDKGKRDEDTTDSEPALSGKTKDSESEQQVIKEEMKKQEAVRAVQEEAKLAEQKRLEEEAAVQKRQEEAVLAEQKRKEEEEKKRQAEIEAQRIAATQQEQKVYDELKSKFISLLASYKQEYEGNYGRLEYEDRNKIGNDLNTKYSIPLMNIKEQLSAQPFQYVKVEPLRVGMVHLESSIWNVTAAFWINDSLRGLNNATYSAFELGMAKTSVYNCITSTTTINNCSLQ
ncbi:hypothetical protein [Bacillus sp. MRMR6]|uniref:hypothetical protein n=1 Tax=Bacillus sp. MRMR6 TaxID=1928617 RepID=UPI0009512229|nr:hypothetical protein [Bacillus sp. MRMR6]OLS38593.1 hypothetical protein BTR25_14340 [Bacillus sp. MRMR6]